MIKLYFRYLFRRVLLDLVILMVKVLNNIIYILCRWDSSWSSCLVRGLLLSVYFVIIAFCIIVEICNLRGRGSLIMERLFLRIGCFFFSWELKGHPLCWIIQVFLSFFIWNWFQLSNIEMEKNHWDQVIAFMPISYYFTSFYEVKVTVCYELSDFFDLLNKNNLFEEIVLSFYLFIELIYYLLENIDRIIFC